MKDTRILCEASEKGKIVANRCLENGNNVSTLKIEKLLILMHGLMLSRYHMPLFKQNVVVNAYGLMIKEVDQEMFLYSYSLSNKLVEYICLLDKENEVVNEIIQEYGMLDSFDLSDLVELKMLKELCYEEGKMNVVPNELIEQVFKYYEIKKDIRKMKTYLKEKN